MIVMRSGVLPEFSALQALSTTHPKRGFHLCRCQLQLLRVRTMFSITICNPSKKDSLSQICSYEIDQQLETQFLATSVPVVAPPHL